MALVIRSVPERYPSRGPYPMSVRLEFDDTPVSFAAAAAHLQYPGSIVIVCHRRGPKGGFNFTGFVRHMEQLHGYSRLNYYIATRIVSRQEIEEQREAAAAALAAEWIGEIRRKASFRKDI